MKKTFATPLTPISWGELIDKITILEIKQVNIKSASALININKELGYLNEIVKNNTGLAELIKDLKLELLDVNKRLWQVEDDIRDKELEHEFDGGFIELARRVYRLNDERANLKKSINHALNSELVEEKSYKDFQTNWYESKEEQLLSTSIPILVLNLVRSKERRESFRAFNKHLTYEYFNAIDGRDLTIEQIRASGLFEENLPFPSLGAYGCALSHLRLWEMTIDKNFPITVAEDDAIFRHDFLVQSNKVISTLPSDWDFILWGWNFDSVLSVNLLPAPIVMLSNQELLRRNVDVFQKQLSPSLPLALDKCFGTSAYTISPKGAKRFKELCFPIANFELKFPVLKNKMPTMGIDVAMARFFSTTNSFVSFPPLVITKNEHSISTVQNNSLNTNN